MPREFDTKRMAISTAYYHRHVRYVRKARGLTATAVAAALEIKLDRYRQIENGTIRKIRPEEKERMAMFFGIAAEELLQREGEVRETPAPCRVTIMERAELEEMLARQFGSKLRAVRAS